MDKPIYCDYAATAPMHPATAEIMMRCMETCWGNPSSAHGAGNDASEALESARSDIAACLNAAPCEITFTSGGTESDNLAIYSAAEAGRTWKKMHIVASATEHPAVYVPIKYLETQGFAVTWLPADSCGRISICDFRNAIRDDTCLCAVMMVNNETGSIQPVRELGLICKEKKVPFMVDAVQAAGHIPIDVKEIGCTYLTMSAHKFGGPRGIGALFSDKNCGPLFPMLLGGGQEHEIRSGTENVPGAVAMAHALKHCVWNMPDNMKKLESLRLGLGGLLAEIPGARFLTPLRGSYPGILSVSFDDVEGSALVLMLSAMGVYASAGSACHAGSNEPSRVLMNMGYSRQVASSALRLSLSPDMTPEQIRTVASSVGEAVSNLRSYGA